MKFRSQIAGYITGVRFYKGSTNTGVHVGKLWTRTGTLLATATFTNETASGWQEVLFSSPVAIAANTTYVASYHSSSGYFAFEEAYFAAAINNYPLRALANGEDGPNGVYKYGASGFPTWSYNSSNYWVDVVFAIELEPDTTPPTVSSVSPVNGAEGVSISTTVTVTFSEPVDPLTIGPDTFELRDPSNELVPATVTYQDSTRTATLQPVSPLDPETAYLVTVTGGPGGVEDVAGNVLAGDYTWSFTTSAAATGVTYSIWNASAIPANPVVGVGTSCEVGVKFRSQVAGYITGVRFYKGSANTGVHAGHLWTGTGTLLASATFSNETASGWQEVLFSSPVAITANTTYVASYYGVSGYIAFDEAYFVAGVDNYPLRALANGEDGPNGLYKLGASGFPNQSWNSSNYWVDVVFATSIEDDTTPPAVTSVVPANGGVGVNTGTNVTVAFSEPMDAATINSSTFELRDASNALVSATVTYNGSTRTATLQPSSPLAYSITYTPKVFSGVGGVKDTAGNPLAADYNWSFTTVTSPGDTTPPTIGSVSPINGATGVAIGGSVSAVFSEDMDAATINGSTFELRDGSSALVPATVTYNGSTRTATLQPSSPLANSTTYTARMISGAGGVKDVAGNPLAVDYGWSFTTETAPGDTTPPTVGSVSPAGGATGVAIGGSVSAVFSEDMDAATINGSTFELRAGSSALVPATVTYNGSTRTATLQPSSPLANSTTYTARMISGAAGVKDVAGNPLAADYGWSFTTEAAPGDTTPPTAPSNLTVLAVGSDQILLSWGDSTDNEGVTGYRVERCQGAGCSSFTQVYSTSGTGTTYSDTELLTATSYSYRVRAADAAGNVSPYSNIDSATTLGLGNRDALVLVNRLSPNYEDFQRFIKPYLDNFGIPYGVLDIAGTQVLADVGDCAVIIIGHRQLDTGAVKYLDATEQGYISAAVNGGTGLVNFDNDLFTNSGGPRYTFIQDVFGFGYQEEGRYSGVSFTDPASHYITERHTPGETISTTSMTLVDATLPTGATLLATTGARPFLSVTDKGSGHAVQWGTYEWMSHYVKGPLLGLDDLVWRSIVWSARKPFIMQGLPPFVTMRVDDVASPLSWIPIANDFGFVPWAGLFTDDIDAAEAVELSNLVHAGKATAAMHSFNLTDLFYFDHFNSIDFPDTTMADHYAAATAWFNARQIPHSKYVVPHYYEIGTNAFGGLENLGVEYLGIGAEPGQRDDSAQHMRKGPFRLYEVGIASQEHGNVYYADFIDVPGHPEMGGKFFNCITEIRDVTGYDWLISGRTGVTTAILDGTAWLKRSFDSMVLATLFTHEQNFVGIISQAQWQAIMQGITQNIAAYNPLYVSMDYACQYVRAIYTSDITNSDYDPATQQVTVTLGGHTDMPTKVYIFRENGGVIQENLIDVPMFDGSVQVVFDTPLPPDTTPPTVSSVSPVNGAEGVSISTTVTVTFSEPVDPLTIGPDTFELRDPFNVLVPATVTYQDSTRTATLQPVSPLDPETSCTVTVVGGPGGVEDVAGNMLAGDYTWSFTTAAAATGVTYSIWNASAIPANPVVGVGTSCEVGVKFRSQLAGFITGVRFYKGSANTGVHAGHLWTRTGTLLASATFTNETASGWQEVLFSSPVAITANTTYVVSYHGVSGYVAFDEEYFVAGVDNYPLRALANGEDGPNGLYRIGASGFPNQSWNSSNYWVDVVFATSIEDDTTPPAVTAVFPASGAADVNIGTNAAVTFSEPMDAATINGSTFELRDGSSALVPATVTYNSSTRTATLQPGSPLSNATAYTARVLSGAGGVKDAAGNPLEADYGWSFTTSDEGSSLTLSIWDASDIPAFPAVYDGQPCEIGVKFRSQVAGYITGLRFYKGSANTGTHVGNLWTRTGTLLASAIFTNETASGWQEVLFSSPVPIAANTTYVASYHSASGYFAFEEAYFTTAVDNYPLRALANGEDGPNGVYKYGASGFPTWSYNSSNYWIDVVFTP